MPSSGNVKRDIASVEDLDEDEITRDRPVKHLRVEQTANSFFVSPPIAATTSSTTFDPSRDEDFDADDFATLDALNADGVDLDDILKLVDEAPQVEDMNETQLRVAISHLQKTVDKNFELRMKYVVFKTGNATV